MMGIEQKSVSACLQQKFNLPTYQREYKWGITQLQDLLSDIQHTFLSQWDASHGRNHALSYKEYFLGSIITAPGVNGSKIIIDGQQRVTTLTLVLCYFHRYSLLNPNLDISPVDINIRRKLAGVNSFNLDVSGARESLLNILMGDDIDDISFCSSVDSIPNKDTGTIKMWDQYQKIGDLIDPEILSNNLMPNFIDYLTERVYLYQIIVDDESDGHKVFVTMNDRGLKLTPIDLLKGFLLSGVSVPKQNRQAHEAWQNSVSELNKLSYDESSLFIKNWLRSKYAKTNRAKRTNEEPKDFDVIAANYHRWVIEKKDELSLKNNDDYFEFITKDFVFYSKVYLKIRELECKLNMEFPHVYYNGSRDLTVQAMIIMSAIKPSDTDDIVDKKISLVSYYLDFMSTVRYLNSKANTHDSLRDLSFKMVIDFRNKGIDDLKDVIFSKIKLIENDIQKIDSIRYDKANRKLDLLRFLSRIASFLEVEMSITNAVGYETYVNRQLDHKTFDIEHMLCDDYVAVNSYLSGNGSTVFSTKEEFSKIRNSIGNLILLPRGRNRSMQDAMYNNKLSVYSTENVLAQCLTDAFYTNQPNYSRFSSSHNLVIKPYPIMDKEVIKERMALYQAIAIKLWSLDTATQLFGHANKLDLVVVNDTD